MIGIVEKREISGISGPMVSQDDNFYRLCRECVYLCCKTLALMPPLYCRRCATKPPRDSRFAVTSIMHSGGAALHVKTISDCNCYLASRRHSIFAERCRSPQHRGAWDRWQNFRGCRAFEDASLNAKAGQITQPGRETVGMR